MAKSRSASGTHRYTRPCARGRKKKKEKRNKKSTYSVTGSRRAADLSRAGCLLGSFLSVRFGNSLQTPSPPPLLPLLPGPWDVIAEVMPCATRAHNASCNASPAVSSGADNTRGCPGGDLMGGGASSEAGCRLVSVWVSARGE